jgi:acyl carrier protein
MRDQLRALVAGALDVPVDQVPPDASPENVPQWDSLHHIELMLALELEYGVVVTTDVLPTLLSLEAIEEFLRDQGVAEAA